MSLAFSAHITKELSSSFPWTMACWMCTGFSSTCLQIVSYTASAVKYERAQVTVGTCGADAFFYKRTKNSIMKRRKRFQTEFWRETCNEISSLSVGCIGRKSVLDGKPVLLHQCVFGKRWCPKSTVHVARGSGSFLLHGCCSRQSQVPHVPHCCTQPFLVTNVENIFFCEEPVVSVRQRDVRIH